jgi:hypothetical protein
MVHPNQGVANLPVRQREDTCWKHHISEPIWTGGGGGGGTYGRKTTMN